MTDDQVECEWVNVSSGTGLPGLSRTKGVKRLSVCVCVCVCVSGNHHPYSHADLQITVPQSIFIFISL